MLAMNPYKRSCPERQENQSALQHAMQRIHQLECEVVEQSRMIYCLTDSLTESSARYREDLKSREDAAKKLVQEAVGRMSEKMVARDGVRDAEGDQRVREITKYQMEEKMQRFNEFVDKKEAEFRCNLKYVLDFYDKVKILNDQLITKASPTDGPSSNSSTTNATTTKSASSNSSSTNATTTKSASTNTPFKSSLPKMKDSVESLRNALKFYYGLEDKKQGVIDSLKTDIKERASITNDNIKGMETKLVDFACDLQELLETNRKLRTLITDNEGWVVGHRPQCTACTELSTRVYEPYLGEFARDSARWFKLLPTEDRLDTMFDIERAKRSGCVDEMVL